MGWIENLMVPSESAPQYISNEWSGQKILTKNRVKWSWKPFDHNRKYSGCAVTDIWNSGSGGDQGWLVHLEVVVNMF
jgi:hypothetical protein